MDHPKLTVNILCETMTHEGLVREAYRDIRGNWTWGFGLTNASGHKVHPRYLDKPQSLEHCFTTFEWVMRTRYLTDVLDAFELPLSETELGAALSFHWNTGGIGRAIWVDSVNRGDMDAARAQFMNWTSEGLLTKRRERERDLFFDGVWHGSLIIPEYTVQKPSYQVDWSAGAKNVDISDLVNAETPQWPKTFRDNNDLAEYVARRLRS